MFCFKTRFKYFEKNEHIISQGQDIEDLIMIVRGSAKVESVDSFGDINVWMKLKKGDVFGIETAYSGDKTYKDNLIATERTLVLFMNKHRVLNPCENKCKRHDFVVKHLVQIVAESNIQLQDKLAHMSKKTIRDKLLSYFHSLTSRSGSNYFELPFNKTELANYLSVDRSAMSTELTKMKDDGIIDFEKRQFHLIKKD
jgi:CRP-like cAMP-binding protein